MQDAPRGPVQQPDQRPPDRPPSDGSPPTEGTTGEPSLRRRDNGPPPAWVKLREVSTGELQRRLGVLQRELKIAGPRDPRAAERVQTGIHEIATILSRRSGIGYPEAVARLLSSDPADSHQRIADDLDVSQSTVRRWAKQLRELTGDPPPRRGRPPHPRRAEGIDRLRASQPHAQIARELGASTAAVAKWAKRDRERTGDPPPPRRGQPHPRRAEGIDRLRAGQPHAQIARELGVTKRSVQRWAKEIHQPAGDPPPTPDEPAPPARPEAIERSWDGQTVRGSPAAGSGPGSRVSWRDGRRVSRAGLRRPAGTRRVW